MARFVKLIAILLCLLTVVAREAVAQRHGEVSSRNCPYDCRTQGIPKSDCREWRQGTVCYVEDLRVPGPSGAPTPIPSTSAIELRSPADVGASVGASEWSVPKERRGSRATDERSQGGGWDGDFGTGVGECERLKHGDIPPPKISVGRIRPVGGGLDRMRVSGSIEGVCLVEAGYFEDGRKVESIHTSAQRRFQRYAFDITGHISPTSELRVTNAAGDSDVKSVKLDPSQINRGPGITIQFPERWGW